MRTRVVTHTAGAVVASVAPGDLHCTLDYFMHISGIDLRKAGRRKRAPTSYQPSAQRLARTSAMTSMGVGDSGLTRAKRTLISRPGCRPIHCRQKFPGMLT